MTGYVQITREEFYALGGLSNPNLVRAQRRFVWIRWTYWKRGA